MPDARPPSRPAFDRSSILGNRDLIAGLMFVAIAALGLVLSSGYDIGTSTRMGTGYVPRLVCWCLLALGLLVALNALRGAAEEADGEPVEAMRWMPAFIVAAATMAFGLAIEPLGFIAASVLLIAIGTLAARDTRLLETVIVAIVLVVGSALLFVELLGLPMSLWPRV